MTHISHVADIYITDITVNAKDVRRNTTFTFGKEYNQNQHI